MSGFELNLATEQQPSSFEPFPANTVLRVKCDFQGPAANMSESVETRAPANWGGYLIHQDKHITQTGVEISESLYIKMKLTVTGTQDGKRVGSVIFHNAVLNGGRPANPNPKGGMFPSDAENGQGTIYDMCLVAFNIDPKSPQATELKKNPPIAQLNGKEFVVVTQKPYYAKTDVDKTNGRSQIYGRGFLLQNDKRYQTAMNYGKSVGGFGGVSTVAPAMSAWGNAPAAPATPSTGGFGAWGSSAKDDEIPFK